MGVARSYLRVFGEERSQVEELSAHVLCELFRRFARLEVVHVWSFDVDDPVTPVLIHSIRNVSLVQEQPGLLVLKYLTK